MTEIEEKKIEKKKNGRPSKYSPELAATICELLSRGASVREIGRMEEMPDAATIFRWAATIPSFYEQYAPARELCLEHWAEQCVEISNDETRDYYIDQDGERRSDNTAVQRDRLRVDTKKWILSKLLPKKYGDKFQQEISGKDGKELSIIVNIGAKTNKP